jgi:hypothetical protein
MITFTESYARLADDSYRDGTLLGKTPYKILSSIDRSSGYHGVIYQNRETSDIVVAHRGTEFEGDKLRDLLATDGQMALIKLNQQLDGARQAVELALQYAKVSGSGEKAPEVSVTGHSLGGALAQMTAAEYGLRGETFNAYGAAGLYGTPAGGTQVINHVRATDMVSAAGQHFGGVRIYATEQDVELLLRDGSPVRQQSPLEFIRDVAELSPGKTHRMTQFYGPDSIVRPENFTLYEQNQADFDTYRNLIRGSALIAREVGHAPQIAATVGAHLAGSYLAQKIIGAFDGNDELQRLRDQQLREERAARYEALPGLGGGPRAHPGRPEWQYERAIKELKGYGDDGPAKVPAESKRDPAHPDHPDHAMLEQIRSRIREIDRSHGREFDERSERLSHSLLAEARWQRLSRVDHVLLSLPDHVTGKPENIFLVQGRMDDPAHLRLYVNIEAAITTPIAASDERLEAINQRLAQEQTQAQQLAQQRAQQQEIQGAPAMRV